MWQMIGMPMTPAVTANKLAAQAYDHIDFKVGYYRHGHNGAHQIWVRPMQNGDVAAALINTGSAAIDLTLELRGVLCVACGDAAMVEDLWGTDPPVLAKGAYTAKGVRPHETVLLRLSLVK